jgi:hypothetical protein
MNLLTEKTRQNKFDLLHSDGISINKYNISSIEKLYVISSVFFLSVGIFFDKFDIYNQTDHLLFHW